MYYRINTELDYGYDDWSTKGKLIYDKKEVSMNI